MCLHTVASVLLASEAPISTESTLASKTKRINPTNRIWRILKQVDPTSQPNRILRNKPPDPRIVIPEPVVVQPGFLIEVLALESEGLLDRRCRRRRGAAVNARQRRCRASRRAAVGACPGHGAQPGLAPDLVVGGPDDLAEFVGELQRGADLVALVPVGAIVLDGGQGHEAVRLVEEQRLALAAGAVDHQVTVPEVGGGAEGVGLAHAPAQGVIGVAGELGHAVAGDLGLGQAVLGIPGEVGDLVGALAAGGDVAVGVVIEAQVLVDAQAVGGEGGVVVGAEQVAGGVEGEQLRGVGPAVRGQDAPGGASPAAQQRCSGGSSGLWSPHLALDRQKLAFSRCVTYFPLRTFNPPRRAPAAILYVAFHTKRRRAPKHHFKD